MTKQQKLKFQLDNGETVIFQDIETNKYIAIGDAGKDWKGDYRTSKWCYTMRECMQHLGLEDGFTPEELEKNLKSWKYIDSIPPKHNPVPVGTKVRILENAKKECEKFGIGWNEKREKMIGNVYEIEKYWRSDYVIKGGYVFPRSAFVIAEGEDEVEEETIMIKNGKQYKVKIIEEIK